MSEFDNPYSFLAANAERIGDELAIASVEQEITWSELQFEVDRISAKLRFLGVKPGQIVTLLGENINLWKLQLAIMKLAAVPAVISMAEVPPYLADELLITDRAVKTNARNVVVADEAWLKDAKERFKPVAVEAGYSPEDPIRLVMTSGTTGTPKAVVISYAAFKIRTNTTQLYWDVPMPEFSMMGFSAAIGFWTALRSLTNGSVFISITGSARKMASLIEKYQVRTVWASPAQIATEANYWKENDERLKSIDRIILTGASTNHLLITNLKKKVNARLINRFGSSEAGAISQREFVDENDDEKWIGPINEGSAVRIVDENNIEVPVGEVGSLQTKSPVMFSGYWKNEAETKKRLVDGWFVTGDLAYIAPGGRVTLSARDSEIINAGGVKVDPDRVDITLAAHPIVVDCGTFQLNRKNGQVLIVTMAILREKGKLKELADYLKARLGAYRSKMIFPVDKIPRNANGKLDRVALAKMYSTKVDDYMSAQEAKRGLS